MKIRRRGAWEPSGADRNPPPPPLPLPLPPTPPPLPFPSASGNKPPFPPSKNPQKSLRVVPQTIRQLPHPSAQNINWSLSLAWFLTLSQLKSSLNRRISDPYVLNHCIVYICLVCITSVPFNSHFWFESTRIGCWSELIPPKFCGLVFC